MRYDVHQKTARLRLQRLESWEPQPWCQPLEYKELDMAIVTEISWNDMFAGKALPDSPARIAFREGDYSIFTGFCMASAGHLS